VFAHSFITDLTIKLNDLNADLQSKNKIIIKMIGTTHSFKGEMKLPKTRLMKGVLNHFSSVQCGADGICEASVYIV
jgi:hypothetical protein